VGTNRDSTKRERFRDSTSQLRHTGELDGVVPRDPDPVRIQATLALPHPFLAYRCPNYYYYFYTSTPTRKVCALDYGLEETSDRLSRGAKRLIASRRTNERRTDLSAERSTAS